MNSSPWGNSCSPGFFASTLFQDIIPQAVVAGGALGRATKALLLMMGLAFVLSLCSSSDAVVARSMAGSLTGGAVLGFIGVRPHDGHQKCRHAAFRL
ncbi:MAG: hypothetical protein ACLR0U_12835 [Enterocloster clostridioformis]